MGDLSTFGWFRGRNVIGISPGTEKGTILFTGHRDAVPKAPEGAYDDGSGTAAVMELARVLSPGLHRYTYVFAALDGEEVGLAGARVLMNRRIPELKDIRLSINLDPSGRRSHSMYLPCSSPGARAGAGGLLTCRCCCSPPRLPPRGPSELRCWHPSNSSRRPGWRCSLHSTLSRRWWAFGASSAAGPPDTPALLHFGRPCLCATPPTAAVSHPWHEACASAPR